MRIFCTHWLRRKCLWPSWEQETVFFLQRVPFLLIAWLCAHCLEPRCGAAQINEITTTNVLANPAQIYREFLSNPPWIKKIVFRLDRNYRVDVTDRLHPQRQEGQGAYEAALQPSGYYRKHLDGSFLYDNPPGMDPPQRPVVAGSENVSGASDRFFWRLWEGQGEVSMVPKDGESGASPDNWLRGFFDVEMTELENVRKLGLDKLVEGKISWIDNDHFVAELPHQRSAQGTIVSYTNGSPEIVEYTIAPSNSPTYQVHYSYKTNRLFPPFEIRIADFDENGQPITHVNCIDSLELGIDPSIKTGYYPEAFRARTDAFKKISISSNGVLYQVDQHARMKPVDTRYSELKAPQPVRRNPVLAATILVAPSVVFLLLFVITKSREKKNAS